MCAGLETRAVSHSRRVDASRGPMRSPLLLAGLAAVVLPLLACGDSPPPASPAQAAPVVRTTPPPPAAAAPLVDVRAGEAPNAEAAAFQNPGGMWMPHQIAEGAHAATLKKLGLAFDPKDLSDPTSGVLSSVVSLGGCSASFVSEDGLVATNHHCATGALQHNSSGAKNLLEEGFLAKTRAEEKSNGPQARVFVTRAVTDVTSVVRKGLDAIKDDRARWKEIEKRQKEIVAACEKSGTSRCSVSSFYEGAQYYLAEQLEIRDVRLVWAPPAGVGNYGGEIDNWRWPRHTGDVSFFRAYVGKDGKPADFAESNVPYKPAHHLKVASTPLRPHDLVFVAGYPGRTSTLKTSAEVEEAVTWGYPRRQKMFEDYLARLDEVTKDDKEAKVRATSWIRRFGNALTNTKGQLDGLLKGGLAKQKATQDASLRAFVDGAPDRKAKWGKALSGVDEVLAAQARQREADAELEELTFSRLLAAAMTIVRMAEERPKPDAERDPDYQARNWLRHEQAMKAISTSYHRKVDEAMLSLALERIALAPAKDRSRALAMVAGTETSREGIAKAVSARFATTKLDDEKTRLELLTKATTAELAKSKDGLVQLAVALRPLVKDAEERRERLAGKLAMLKPQLVEARRAMSDAPFAPDANSTLRVTYGTVRGYKPAPSAETYTPFTLVSQVIAKNQKKEPFLVPEALVRAFEQKRFGPYVDAKLGEVPVDFLADLHITGGNSGSATLNAKGELTGLVFDGNYEAMASDWLFVPEMTRSIHVDIRYVLWLLDAVVDGDHLLKEMGVTPKVN